MTKTKNKTQEIQEMVRDALELIPRPYTKEITYLVCKTIEANQSLFQKYQKVLRTFGRHISHQRIGRYTSEITGLRSNGIHIKVNDTFIKSYSELV
jgi:hypothetical protein